MGSSISKSKSCTSLPQGGNDKFACSTTSSERTMVQQQSMHDGSTKKNSFFGSSSSNNKNKPSILPSNGFFSNMRSNKNKLNKKDKVKPHSAKINVNSLSKRKPRHNKRKKMTFVVTKSIIGKPTNFKHLNSSTTQFDHMQFLQDNDDEAAKIAAQIVILSSLIKPLPDNNDNDNDKIPVIPKRSSSYGNDIYIREFPIPTTTIAIATPSLKKKYKKRVVGMKKNNNGSMPRTSIARKHGQYHARSVKKLY